MKFTLKSPKDWRKSDKEYFTLLCSDLDFEGLVKEARTELGLNHKNLPTAFDDAKTYSNTEKYAGAIIDLFDLSDMWKEPLRFFIVTGTIFSPGSGVYLEGLSLRFNSPKKKFLRPSPFRVTVTEKMGYSSLVKYISKHKEYIKNYLEKLPRRRAKAKNLTMYLEVKRLLNSGKSIKQILDYLTETYPHDAPDEGTLRLWIKRINQTLKGLKIS